MKTLTLNKKTLVRLASKEMQDLIGGKRVSNQLSPSETTGENCDSINTKFTEIPKCC